jgi:hypothetical protein
MSYNENYKVKCGIINLEESDENGSHWTAYYKNNSQKYPFDSYGEASLPNQLLKYLRPKN